MVASRELIALLLLAVAGWLVWTRYRWWPIRWRVVTVAITWGALPFWKLALGFLVAWAVGRTAASAEQGVRFAGLVLQWLGLILVALGIRDTRARFEEPPILHRIVLWVDHIRGAFGAPRHIALSAQPAVVHVRVGSASLSTSSWQNPNLGARVKALELAFEAYKTQAERERHRLLQQLDRVSGQLDTERHQRVAAVESINRLLAAHATGGIVLETIGVIWLVVGAAMGAVPEELATVFAR